MTVPEGVVTIPEDAFSNCNKIVQIKLPDTVTTISNYAFNGMTGIERFVIPNNVTTISYYAFSGCTSLKDIWIGEKVTEINNYAFANCNKELLVIHGVDNSYAQTWADDHGYTFSTSELNQEDAVITGKVLLGGGGGLEGVNVVLYDRVKNKVLDTFTTDENGEWRYEQATVGYSYEVTYFHADCKITPNKIAFIADSENELDNVTASKMYDFTDSPSEYFEYATISGSNIQITKYTGNEKQVIIPSEIDGNTVTKIGKNSFSENQTIELVRIPKNVTEISEGAFYKCSQLEDVIFAGFTETIGTYAFQECTSLTTIDLPETLRSIGYEAFYKCSGFTTIELPNSVTTIGGEAFAQCTNLTSINYPTSLTKGAGQIFNGDTKLTSIEVPEGVTVLAESAFESCKNIKEIKLPSTLKEINNHAMENCTGLTGITLPEELEKIGYCSFYGDTGITGITLPDGLKEIGGEAFSGSGLIEIVIPDSVTNIGGNAFKNCTSLTSTTYPKGLSKTSSGIYQGCSKLKAITVPEGVTELPEDVFSNCSNFATINLPSTLDIIGNYAFSNCIGLKGIEIPENVTKIGYSVFYGCTGIKEVVLPDGVKTIGGQAFKNCTALNSINYPKSLESTGSEIYNGCTSLKNMTVPEGVVTIPEDAFNNASSMRNILLPKSLEKIENYAFYNCKGLSSLNLPSKVKMVGSYAYSGCDGLLKVDISNAIQSLEYSAFSNCTNLKEVVIESGSLNSIKAKVFSDCKKLISIYLPRNIKEIDDSTFDNDSNITFYCPYVSYATLYAIKHNIPFISSDNNFDDDENSIINRANTYYYSDVDGMAYNGYIKMKLEYSITDEQNNINNKKIQFFIPDNVDVKESTIKVGNVMSQSYQLDGNILTIPIDKNEDEIVFYVKPFNNETIMSYAQLFYTNGNEILGIINESMTVLTMNCDDEVSSDNISINGYGPKQSTVSIYVDDKKVKDISTSKTGKYSTSLSLQDPVDEKEYVVKAECVDNGEKHSVENIVTYSENSPELKSLKLYYNNHSDAGLDLLNNDTTPYVSFNPAVPFTFTADITNKDKVEEVYIVSTRNNVKKYIEAKYDTKKKIWIASGYFDETNHSYVPGKISVDINKKHETPKISENIAIDTNNITEAMAKTKVTKINGNFGAGGGGYRFDVTDTLAYVLADTVVEMDKTYIDYTISMIDEEADTNLSEIVDFYKALDTVSGYFIPDENGHNWFATADYSDGSTWTLLLKDTTSSVNKIIKLKMSLDSDQWTTLNEISPYLGLAAKGFDTANKLQGLKKDNKELRDEIMMNSSIVDKELALKKADQLYNDQYNYTVMMAVLPLLVTVGFGISGPVAIGFTALCGMIGATSSFFWKARIADIKGQSFGIRWAIDPSGYVYEGVTSNRLSDVTVTAYYKEKLSDEKAILWDASEYDQVNPLITGYDGVYAWDVPEGYWQVKYEKTGYTTVYSEWMEVPPPQTDVNIKMSPEANLEISSINVYSDRTEIEFNQYVSPTNVSDIVLKDSSGNIIKYTLNYDNSKTDSLGDSYAVSYSFVYDEVVVSENSEISISLPDSITSDGGKKLNKQNVVKTCEKEMSIIASDSATVEIGKEVSIPITIKNYKEGCALKAYSDFPAIVSVIQDIEVNGSEGNVIVTGELYGTSTVKIICDEKDVAVINITVGDSTDIGTIKYKVSYLGGEGTTGDLPDTMMYEDGESFNLPECKLTKADCIFDGWYDGETIYKSGEQYVIDGNDVIFFAKWTENTEHTQKEEKNGDDASGDNTSGNQSGGNEQGGNNSSDNEPRGNDNNNTNTNPNKPTVQGESRTEVPKDTTTTPESHNITDSKYAVSVPGRVNIKGIKNSAKKTMTISWKKLKTKGYEVDIALNKKFTKRKSTKLTTKTSLKVKKLKKGKTYYVRVRAYNLNGKKKVYGKWSAVKKIKIKK